MSGVKVTANTIWLNEKWNKIVSDMKISNKLHVEIGFPSPSPQHIEKDRFIDETSSDKLNLASLALVMEKGTVDGHIPPRPFMKQTFDANRAETVRLLERALSLILAGAQTPKNALASIGLWYKSKMQQKMIDGDFVKNAPLTVALKGSSKPLLDWGHLRKSVKSKVVGQ